ncbi:hypothetical protein COD05_06195 [Bacillus cereus]|uniref:restriction endonuclease subunit S n=1 Tax=Bacillus sp. AW TaxID=2293329 RepID=UPI000BF2CD5A|nr:hypothetical protein COJ53_07125 [Bacillus cereus]PGP32395.1 hypothetical protein CN989_28180 [Bacillus cereus]PGT11588.1 hypothetical protein COD05_06195 [Bacillus cereus]RFB76214.1 restriction endonuclease subunit S [Bacillus sp. AW]
MTIQLINYDQLKVNWNPSFYSFEPTASPYEDTRSLAEVCEILPDNRKVSANDINIFSKYIDVSCIDKEKGIIEQVKDIEERISKRLRYIANEGDLILPLIDTGKIPAVIFSTEDSHSILVSDIFAVLVPKVEAQYLYWALTTEYVQNQLLARQQGSVLKRISVKSLKEIKIPWLNDKERQKKIQMIKEKLNHLNQQDKQSLLEKTNQVFQDYFNIDPLEGAHQVFQVSYSRLKNEKWNAFSLDPRFDEFERQIREKVNVYYPLNDIVTVVAGVNPAKHKGTELTQYPIVKGKNLDVHAITGEIDYVELKTINDKEVLKKGDILFRTKGRIGPASLVTSEFEGMVFHDHLVKIKVDHKFVIPEYLSLVLNSYIADSQIQRYVSPSTTMFITVQDLIKILIPVPDINQQNKIVRQIVNESSIEGSKI